MSKDVRATGMTYIGPRSFVFAFCIVCGLFLAMFLTLERLTDPGAASVEPIATVAAPVGTTVVSRSVARTAPKSRSTPVPAASPAAAAPPPMQRLSSVALGAKHSAVRRSSAHPAHAAPFIPRSNGARSFNTAELPANTAELPARLPAAAPLPHVRANLHPITAPRPLARINLSAHVASFRHAPRFEPAPIAAPQHLPLRQPGHPDVVHAQAATDAAPVLVPYRPGEPPQSDRLSPNSGQRGALLVTPGRILLPLPPAVKFGL